MLNFPMTSIVNVIWDSFRKDMLERFRLFTFGIDGIEVTQAIQYYHAPSHLTDTADQQPDNSVQLVAGKPAWARVYVRAGGFGTVSNITGTLEITRLNDYFVYTSVATLTPTGSGTVNAPGIIPGYAAERGNINSSLNFIIPAQFMFGIMRMTFTLSAGSFSSTETINISATLQQTLRLAGIMVGYNGSDGTPAANNLTLAAPTLADLQTTSGTTLTMFPVRSFATYRTAGSITWTQPLTDPATNPGGCSLNWLNLNNAVNNVRVTDGNRTDVLYYGLMAPGIPMGPVVGCNTGGVSTGGSGDGMTMAHELGHACGLAHGPCNTPGDPNYPAYEPYDPVNIPNASIGEYGLDINNGNIFSPATFRDLMSYCGPRWISLYHYGRLLNNANLAPITVGQPQPWWLDHLYDDPFIIPEWWLPDPPPWEKFDPFPYRSGRMNLNRVIAIVGTVLDNEEISVYSVTRVAAVDIVQNGRFTPYTAELIGAEGEILARGKVMRVQAHGHGGCGCGCDDDDSDAGSRPPYNFIAFVADAAPGAALRIIRADATASDDPKNRQREVWTRRAPASPPEINEFSGRADGQSIHFGWSVKAAGEDVQFALRFSTDKGKTWNALQTDIREDAITLDGERVPSGEILVQLLANDGFFTTTSEPLMVYVPLRAPSVSILHPRADHTYPADSPLRLWCAASPSTGTPAEAQACQWFIDGKRVGEGMDTFVVSPSEGEHRLTLTVSADGERVEQSLVFRTAGTRPTSDTPPTHNPHRKG